MSKVFIWRFYPKPKTMAVPAWEKYLLIVWRLWTTAACMERTIGVICSTVLRSGVSYQKHSFGSSIQFPKPIQDSNLSKVQKLPDFSRCMYPSWQNTILDLKSYRSAIVSRKEHLGSSPHSKTLRWKVRVLDSFLDRTSEWTFLTWRSWFNIQYGFLGFYGLLSWLRKFLRDFLRVKGGHNLMVIAELWFVDQPQEQPETWTFHR